MTLQEAVKRLKDAGIESAEYDARELFIHFLGRQRAGILPKNESFENEELIHAVERREKREPLQYIIGNVGFFRETYTVTPSVLIPRQDTEILVEYAVNNIPENENVLDLCTGSGCIAISTLKNTKNTRAVAVDISGDALEVAIKNAQSNGVADRIRFIEHDLTSRESFTDERFYAILSNPPYVAREAYETLEPEIFCEPEIAFVGENGGMAFYERLLPLSLSLLKEGGFIAYEIGFDQGEAIRALAHIHNCDCKIIKDYSSLDRVAVIKPR